MLLPEVVLALKILNVDLMSHERSDKFFKLIFVKVFGFFYGRDLVYLGCWKGSENFLNELWLSVCFAKSFQDVYNIGESGIHLIYYFRFNHLEDFILGDK